LRGEAQIKGIYAVPHGGETDRTGFGLGAQLGLGWGKIPLTAGFDLSYVNWSSSVAYREIENATVRIDADDVTNFADLWLRLQPPFWPVRPYFEVFYGTQLVKTEYEISVGSALPSEGVSDQDWASSRGFGAGIDFVGLSEDSYAVFLGVRRVTGGFATFRREVDGDGTPTIVTFTEPTSSMLYSVGLAIRCCGQ
jgi:hypothetical protein